MKSHVLNPTSHFTFNDHKSSCVAELQLSLLTAVKLQTLFLCFDCKQAEIPSMPSVLPCQTEVVCTIRATGVISTSHLSSVWSRHRNPLALKKLPPSLCLTSNGAFFSSLSFFMFVCKVLYIT